MHRACCPSSIPIHHALFWYVGVKRFPPWKTQFSLFQDGRGLRRCGGRLQNADLPYSAKHPILLNKKYHLTVLVIRDAHHRVRYNEVRETLIEVRSKFWIIGRRGLIRAVVHGCVVYRRFEGRPIGAPPQPPLPEFHMKEAPPFTYTAIDFAGPLYLRGKEANTSKKVWICLFTCCVSCAVGWTLTFEPARSSHLPRTRR